MTADSVGLLDAERRYASGGDRSRIFCDLVLAEIRRQRAARTTEVTVLDIGCGRGIDGRFDLQEEIAAEADRLVGIEPDPEISLSPAFDETHRSFFEDALIAPSSVAVAYAVFVLEHIADATGFLDKMLSCLHDGGVFWGLTVDGRHPFMCASRLMEAFRLKDRYLDALWGRRGENRYENYSTHYRMNSPRRLNQLLNGRGFLSTASLHRPGQLDFYFPACLRRAARMYERVSINARLPGSILLLRIEKPVRT